MADRAQILLIAGALLAAPGVAVAAPAAKELAAEHRLTQAEIDAVLAAAALRREAGETAGVDSGKLARPPLVDGEVEVAIGTGGYRSAFGSAYVPLPGEGGISVSVGTERDPRRD
jgi:hypothetical protein